MSKQPPPAPTASTIGPCPTVIQIVGRPGTVSLPRTMAPPDPPPPPPYLMGITFRTYSSRPRSDISSSLMKYNKGVHHLPVFFKGLHCKSANFNQHWRKIPPASLRENSKITYLYRQQMLRLACNNHIF